MKNQNSNPPTKEEGLEILSPIHPEVTNALNHGAVKAANYFAGERTKIDHSLESMLVRYHAKLHLENTFRTVVLFDSLSLCGISLTCRGLKWKNKSVQCRLRLWKSWDNRLPTPGKSREKRIFYTQPMLPFPADAVAADEVPREEMHFAILWNLSRKGVLQPLYLVCPKRFNPRTGEIEVWWDVVIPDPTTAIQPGPSGLSIAPREDLDIARKDKKKEQSE